MRINTGASLFLCSLVLLIKNVTEKVLLSMLLFLLVNTYKFISRKPLITSSSRAYSVVVNSGFGKSPPNSTPEIWASEHEKAGLIKMKGYV